MKFKSDKQRKAVMAKLHSKPDKSSKRKKFGSFRKKGWWSRSIGGDVGPTGIYRTLLNKEKERRKKFKQGLEDAELEISSPLSNDFYYIKGFRVGKKRIKKRK